MGRNGHSEKTLLNRFPKMSFNIIKYGKYLYLWKVVVLINEKWEHNRSRFSQVTQVKEEIGGEVHYGYLNHFLIELTITICICNFTLIKNTVI